MKFKNILLLTITVITIINTQEVAAQSKYAVSANFYGGYVLPSSKNLELVATKPALGAELGFEFLPQGNHPWQRWWNMPTVGIGLSIIDLGNPRILGQAFAVYPYLLVPIVNSKSVILNFKMGLGLSANTRTWNMCDTVNGINSPNANASIGSILNGFMLLAANLSIPITDGFYFNFNVGFNHMSDGNIFQPNNGLNILYLTAGASYRINYCQRCEKPKPPVEPFPYKFSIKASIGAGTRELYYKDHRRYLTGTFHVGATYQVAPFYAVGGGLDLFYDGAFVRQGVTPSMDAQEKAEQQQYTKYNRYLITNNDLANKFRFGISLNNEFPISRVTIILDWGIYLYDPIRDAYNHQILKEYPSRGIFYKYDIQREDGWNYFRLGLRCRLYDNLYAQVDVKSHLQKAEFVTFSLGYQFPFKKKEDHGTLQRKGAQYVLYHPDAKHKRGTPAFDNTPQKEKKEPKIKKPRKKPQI